MNSKISSKSVAFWRIQGILSGILIILTIGVMTHFLEIPSWARLTLTLIVTFLAILDATLIATWKYKFHMYSLDETGFQLRTGRLVSKKTHVPARQILYMRTKQGPVLRMNGLMHLQIGTLGEVFSVPYLPTQQALQHVSEYERDTDSA